MPGKGNTDPNMKGVMDDTRRFHEACDVEDNIAIREERRRREGYTSVTFDKDFGIGICEYCGVEYPKNSTRQKYCNDKCRDAAYKAASNKIPVFDEPIPYDVLLVKYKNLQIAHMKLQGKYEKLLVSIKTIYKNEATVDKCK